MTCEVVDHVFVSDGVVVSADGRGNRKRAVAAASRRRQQQLRQQAT